MFCPVCGIKLEQGARFCPNCGEAIGGAPMNVAAANGAPMGAEPRSFASMNGAPMNGAPIAVAQGAACAQQPMPQFQSVASGAVGKAAGFGKKLVAGTNASSNVFTYIGIAAAILWAISVMWVPFFGFWGETASYMAFVGYPVAGVIGVIVVAGSACVDFIARSGREAFIPGVLMIILSIMYINASGGHYDLKFGVGLAITCAIAVAALGALCWVRNK